MAAPEARGIFHLTGRLAQNPSSFATAYPHGGTELSSHARMVFAFNPQGEEILAEEHGGARVDFVRQAERAAFTTLLREYDLDALTAAFPNVAAGASSGRPVITGRVFDSVTGTDSTVAGNLVSANAVAILLSPDAPDSHPAIYVPNALPLVAESAQVQADLGTKFGIALAFSCIPDTAGRLYQFGLLDDLTL